MAQEVASKLSRNDYHSRMRHMMKCPKGEWKTEFARFKSLAVRAKYDFCAAQRNEDGWTIACKDFYVTSPSPRQIALVHFMLSQDSNPLQSNGRHVLLWTDQAPHKQLINWISKHEKSDPKRMTDGGNPLHYFARHASVSAFNSKESIQKIIDAPYASSWINAPDHNGLTPLGRLWSPHLSPDSLKGSKKKPLLERQKSSTMYDVWSKTLVLINAGADVNTPHPSTGQPLSFHIANRLIQNGSEIGDRDYRTYDEIRELQNHLRGAYLDQATPQANSQAGIQRL